MAKQAAASHVKFNKFAQDHISPLIAFSSTGKAHKQILKLECKSDLFSRSRFS